MKITKTQLRTTLFMLRRAGDIGVHEFYISANTTCKDPKKIIDILEKKGYQIKKITNVQLGIASSPSILLGTVYVLLEDEPRVYLDWEFGTDEAGAPVAKQVEKETLPKQESFL